MKVSKLGIVTLLLTTSVLFAAEHSAEIKTNPRICAMTAEDAKEVDIALNKFKELKQRPFVLETITSTNRDGRSTVAEPQKELEKQRLEILKGLIPLVKKSPGCAESVLGKFYDVLFEERDGKELHGSGIDFNRAYVDNHSSLGTLLFDLQTMSKSMLTQKPFLNPWEKGPLSYKTDTVNNDIFYIKNYSDMRPFYSPETYADPTSSERQKVNAMPKLSVSQFKEILGEDGRYHQSYIVTPESAASDFIEQAKKSGLQGPEFQKYLDAEWKDVDIASLEVTETDNVTSVGPRYTAVEQIVDGKKQFKFETTSRTPIKDAAALDFLIKPSAMNEAGQEISFYHRIRGEEFSQAVSVIK